MAQVTLDNRLAALMKDEPRTQRTPLTEADMTDDEARWLRQSTYEKWPPRRLTLIETPFCEYGGSDWSLTDFMATLNEVAAKVPAGAEATVSLKGEYEETTYLVITYERQETDEEFAQRVDKLVRRAKEGHATSVEAQRRQYEALKAKFG